MREYPRGEGEARVRWEASTSGDLGDVEAQAAGVATAAAGKRGGGGRGVRE